MKNLLLSMALALGCSFGFANNVESDSSELSSPSSLEIVNSSCGAFADAVVNAAKVEMPSLSSAELMQLHDITLKLCKFFTKS